LFDEKYSKESPDSIERAFKIEKAVSAQNIFLKGDVITLFVFKNRKIDIKR